MGIAGRTTKILAWPEQYDNKFTKSELDDSLQGPDCYWVKNERKGVRQRGGPWEPSHASPSFSCSLH
jgi:hypothetical protein